MFLVGLTGGIGSGKSQAASIFEEFGVPITDTDAIAHRLTSPRHPILHDIIKEFGEQYLTPDQALDRPALRQKIFSDSDARRRLEAILHPAIYEVVLQSIQQHKHAPYQIIVVPLLFESDRYRHLVDRALLIDCDENLQIERTTARSQLSPPEVEAIIDAQMPRMERLKRADDIIVNDGSIDELRQKVEKMHKNYMQACIVTE